MCVIGHYDERMDNELALSTVVKNAIGERRRVAIILQKELIAVGTNSDQVPVHAPVLARPRTPRCDERQVM